MGLFSAKKTILVSSTVYNMAGDETERPNFLKSSMFAAVMSPHKKFLGETLVTNYLTGPGMKQRQVFNWAVRNNFAGLPTFNVRQSAPISTTVVKGEIPVPGSPFGLVTEIQDAFISDGDYEYFAEAYVLANHPLLNDSDYVSEYNKDDHTITIQFEGGFTETFSAGDYDSNARYVIAHYYHQLPGSLQALVTGGTTTAALVGALPSTTGYSLVTTEDTTSADYTLSQTQTETKSYSNGDPDVVTTTYPNPTISFMGVHQLRTKTVYNGNISGETETKETEHFYHTTEYRQIYTSSSTVVVVNDLGGGVTETVTTVLSGDFLRAVYDYRIDTQVNVLGEVFGGSQIFIYKVGTGNATLDALNVTVGSPVTAEFYPFIPVRLDNVSITASVYETNGLLDECKKIYRRASGREKFLDLVEKVEDNDDLAEIDYAYVQYGVSLNTNDKSCLKYLYTFFKGMIPYQNTDGTYLSSYATLIAAYNAEVTAYTNWVNAQSFPGSSLYGTPKPAIPSLAGPKTTTIQLKTADSRLQDSDTRISWVSIDEGFFGGLGKVGAKKGDYWFEKTTPIEWQVLTGVKKTVSLGGDPTYGAPKFTTNRIEQIYLYHQTGDSSYTRLKIHGLTHQNFIYGGKAVTVTAFEALDDLDNSGFLVPLHNPTIREMGLVDATQMATANTFIVFNSYQIFKKKWYQTFLGMLFIIFVVIVLASLVAPKFVGGLSGALGNNAALGATLGFSGTQAIIAGAFVNALAATVISTVLSEVTTKVFGEKWGALIGSLLSFAFSFVAGGGLSNISSLFTPANLLSLTSALANGYAGYVQANIGEMQADMFENQEKYDAEMERIQKMINDMGGNNSLYFNPMQLTDSVKGNGSGATRGSYMPESLDEFIHRTTLTGSDIVEVTLSLITDFADINLQLPETN